MVDKAITLEKQIAVLNAEKLNIKEKLKFNESKETKLLDILSKKLQSKNNTMSFGVNNKSSDQPLADYRIPLNPIKALPKIIINEPYIKRKPKVVKNTKLLMATKEKLLEKKLSEIKLVEIEKPKIKNTKKHPVVQIPQSLLPNRYLRGELPCSIEHGTNGHYLSWICPLESLDYEYYLPIFFDGLQCKTHPCKLIARQGIDDLLYAAKGKPEKILPCIKNIVRPLRNALMLYDIDITLAVLKVIQQLILGNSGIGEVILPYSKQFLSPLVSFMGNNRNTGDKIDYGQRKNDDIGEEIRKTLELLEELGGPNALSLIKFSIPLYESCLKRPEVTHKKMK